MWWFLCQWIQILEFEFEFGSMKDRLVCKLVVSREGEEAEFGFGFVLKM